ncbi:MAG: serine hydrolase [Anaerolineales bacterium]
MTFRVRPRSSSVRWISSLLLIATVVLVTFQLIVYSRNRANFPAGLVVAEVPVGGISRQEAAERLLEVYALPVELRYGESIIHMDPARVEFNLNLEAMIAAADLQRTGSSFWGGFWDYLWGYVSNPQEVPLDATYSEELLRTYLRDEIASRYDKPPTPAQPVAGTTQFEAGDPGTTVNIEDALGDIEAALFSLTQRSVDLPLQESGAARPNLENLQIQLQQIMDVAAYDGLADIYFLDLASGQELHFIYQLGSNLPTEPDISFTAASIIKIPILVSVYQRLDEEPSESTQALLTEMIIQSFNEPADLLMEGVIDPDRAPLLITEDMQRLGLENTFLAGQFYIGAPLLADIQTPARLRADVDTDPDPYNQTTPSDMGMLLADIYQCAETGGGALVAVLGDDITQAECQDMINLLSANRIAVLLEGGAPEGTRIAHKHGWTTNPTTGVINTMGDSGIVFTPSGDYVVSIFLFQPVQLIFDPAQEMFANLAEAIYNYYTLPDRDFSTE